MTKTKAPKGANSTGTRVSKRVRAGQAAADIAKGGDWKFFMIPNSATIHAAGNGDGYGGCTASKRVAASRRHEVDVWAAVEPGAAACGPCNVSELARRITGGRTQPVGGSEAHVQPSPSGKRRKSTSGQPRTASVAAGSSGDKGEAKADDLAAFAREAGWAAETTTGGPTSFTVTATRDGEIITVTFTDGRLDENQGSWPTWLSNGREVRLRNVSQAKKQMVAQADESRPVRREKRKPIPAKENKADEYADLGSLSDEEVLKSVAGSIITWRNALSGILTEALVPSKIKDTLLKVEMHPKNGHRILSFFSVIHRKRGDEIIEVPIGWRSVYVDKIMRIRSSAGNVELVDEGDEE